MDCTFIKIYLDAYERGQLNKQHEKGIGEHLNDCADCRLELEEIREVNAMFDGIDIPSLPNNFTRNVMKKIRERDDAPNKKNSWQEFSKWGISFVAAGLIMILLNVISLDVNIATLGATEKNPILMEKIVEYSPSSIFNRGLGQIETMIETIESRR